MWTTSGVCRARCHGYAHKRLTLARSPQASALLPGQARFSAWPFLPYPLSSRQPLRRREAQPQEELPRRRNRL